MTRPAHTTSISQTLTIELEAGGCKHVLDVPLYCEPHDFKHLWGWACSKCWEQFFLSDLDSACEVKP